MAKSLIIAEENEVYTRRLKSYLEEKYEEVYAIEVFNKPEGFKEYIKNHQVDIVLMHPAFYQEDLNLRNMRLPIILQEDDPIDLHNRKLKWSIEKYMRISRIVEYMEDQYQEIEKSRPLVMSFYAPAGGVGQTTLAIATAMSYNRIGRKVLYISLEEIDSTELYFGKKSGSLAEHLRFKELNEETQEFAEYVKKDVKTGIFYWVRNGMKQIPITKVQEVIEKMMDYELIDVVIMDLPHGYSDWSALERLDYLILVKNNQIHSQYKLKQLLEQKDFIEQWKGKAKQMINEDKQLLEVEKESLEVVARVEKTYATNALTLCETIAQNSTIHLHGLV